MPVIYGAEQIVSATFTALNGLCKKKWYKYGFVQKEVVCNLVVNYNCSNIHYEEKTQYPEILVKAKTCDTRQ